MAKREKGPWKLIREGNVTVKVYRMAHATAKDGLTHVLAWNGPAGRKRRKIADEAEAVSEARLLAKQLNAGHIEATELTAGDRHELLAVRELAGDTPPAVALREWLAARKLVGSDLIKACEHWAARRGREAQAVTVKEAAKRYTEAKRQDGVKVGAGIERTLPGFVEVFGARALVSITPDTIAGWLAGFNSAGSKNSHRKRVVTFFRWCRKRGMLPLDIQTAAERTDSVRPDRQEIGLVTPEELRRAFALIVEKMPAYVPALVVAAL